MRSLTPEGAGKYASGNGMVAIDVATAIACEIPNNAVTRGGKE